MDTIKKIIIGLGALLFIVFVAQASASKSTKVTICHATSSQTNPYVSQSVDISSLGNGHGNNGVNPGDIIPPTPNTDFPNGNNWTTSGQAIYNNSCNVPTATPTPTQTPSVTPSVTPTLDCDGDTDGSAPNNDDEGNCVIATPTPTPTLDCDGDTDGSTPNNDDENSCVTPTPTVTVAPIATPTPTPTTPPSTTSNSGSNGGSGGGDGRSDGRSDGLSSCPQCTQAPTSSGNIQAVLGASTFAGTGTFDNTVINVMLALGVVLLTLGGLSLAKEKSY